MRLPPNIDREGVDFYPEMLTQAPAPSWSNLYNALRRRRTGIPDLTAPWLRQGEQAGWLSRSAWSLALIALWRKRQSTKSSVTVWLPDFFCNASLLPLRRTGARLVFYPVSEDMQPDMAECRKLIDRVAADVFVLVHYFGQSTPSSSVRDFCAQHGAWMIEDAAQVLRAVKGVGTAGDFVLYSPHKHLPIPDGAVLIVRPDGPSLFGTNGLSFFGDPCRWAGQLSEMARELGLANDNSANTAVWLVKRVLQKLRIPLRRAFSEPFVELLTSHGTAPMNLRSPLPSRLALRLLSGIIPELGIVARRRYRNKLLWDALLSVEGSSPEIRPAIESVREWTPYLAAYSASRVTAQSIYERLQRQNLPVLTWPDLPPEVTGRRENHIAAWRLRHSRFYLPIHQGLSSRRILKQRVFQRYPESASPNVRVEWDTATRADWQALVARMGPSTLLQSWGYGEAKAIIEGWRPRRGTFYRNGEPIALVQVLEKRVTGVFRLSRINRGPLILQSASRCERLAIWKEIALLGELSRGRLLTIAPELPLSGLSLALMARLGFRQFSPRALESVWIDLTLDLSTLRKRLGGKWRNMLTASNKTPLQLEVRNDDESFLWLLSRHEEVMQERNFAGPSSALLRSVRQNSQGDEQHLVLRALRQGEPIAGLCVARHWTAATYLLGWVGAEGRSHRANYFLLWESIVRLKDQGVSWFDLGGINEEDTPGITSFKLGLNGHPYELVGEYWKW